ncbi:MAG: deoxynucleoside kinase [Deltaproteobacteria bacterium]|nr:deoxynucleoside kinase [Deltaproteobacteria bacterium]
MTSRSIDKKIFVAMAGNIGAGKTTVAKLLSEAFGMELFEEPVIDNRFLADYYGDMPRWSFTLQLEFLLKRVQHHEVISRVSGSCIQDRTLYEDPEIFAKYLHGLGNLQDRELELYFDYFERLVRGLHKPDKVICLVVPEAETLLRRIQERGREAESTIKQSFLEGLNGYYTAFPSICENKHGLEVLKIDVTHRDVREGEERERLLDEVAAFLRG